MTVVNSLVALIPLVVIVLLVYIHVHTLHCSGGGFYTAVDIFNQICRISSHVVVDSSCIGGLMLPLRDCLPHNCCTVEAREGPNGGSVYIM